MPQNHEVLGPAPTSETINRDLAIKGLKYVLSNSNGFLQGSRKSLGEMRMLSADGLEAINFATRDIKLAHGINISGEEELLEPAQYDVRSVSKNLTSLDDNASKIEVEEEIYKFEVTKDSLGAVKNGKADIDATMRVLSHVGAIHLAYSKELERVGGVQNR